MVEVEVMGFVAMIDGGVWSCVDNAVLELLIVETEGFDNNPPFYVPDFDAGCAEYMVKKYGGRIVSAPTLPEFSEPEVSY